MTKQFTVEIIESDVFIHQEGANHYLGHKDYVNADMVCDLLNYLSEEKKDLESKFNALKGDYNRCKFRLENIEKENNQLKFEIEELENENEILKGKLWNCQNVR